MQCHAAQQDIKAKADSEKRAMQAKEARNLLTQLTAPLQRCMDLSQEKGASTWLAALPIDNHRFALHKSAFRDALSLSVTIGHLRTRPLIAVVAILSVWSMPCHAQLGGSRRSDTMR